VHDTFQENTPAQTLKGMFSRAQMNMKLYDGDAKWDLIAADLERDSPSYAGQGKAMCDFIRNWAGGADGQFLDEL
ncbi:unnamed protein product, partial [Prorocentrum cordatum]